MTLRNFISLTLFFIVCGVKAQLSLQEKLLWNHQIKKIFIYTLSDPSGNKQLSSIRYLNDSGLTIRLVLLKEGKDTSSISTFKYDSINRIVSDKTDYDGNIYETNYLYPEPYVKIIIDRSDNKMAAKTIKFKIKKHREIQFEYNGDRLVQKLKIIKKRYGYKTVYKPLIGKGFKHRRKIITKEYLNADKNMVRSVTVNRSIKPASKYISTYEYDSLKLQSKLIQLEVKDYDKGDYHRLGRDYSCTVYEYFK